MKIEIKWFHGVRKRPVPVHYACTMTFDKEQLYSVILYFPEQVRTWAELELVVVKDLDIGDDVFYITEGGCIVAEAWIRRPEPTLVRKTSQNGFQIYENGEWAEVENYPLTSSLFHKTRVEDNAKLLRGESCT